MEKQFIDQIKAERNPGRKLVQMWEDGDITDDEFNWVHAEIYESDIFQEDMTQGDKEFAALCLEGIDPDSEMAGVRDVVGSSRMPLSALPTLPPTLCVARDYFEQPDISEQRLERKLARLIR